MGMSTVHSRRGSQNENNDNNERLNYPWQTPFYESYQNIEDEQESQDNKNDQIVIDKDQFVGQWIHNIVPEVVRIVPHQPPCCRHSTLSNHLITTITHLEQSASNTEYTVIDASLASRTKDDEIYAANEDLQFYLRRGLSFLQFQSTTVSTPTYIILRRGFPKFFDLNPTIIQQTINHDSPISPSSRSSPSYFSAVQQLASTQFASRVVEAAKAGYIFDLYALEKLNGGNAQLSFSTELDAWICCSKNVAIVARDPSDLQHPPYSETQQRYEFTREVAIAWFNLLQQMTVQQINLLKSLLSRHTLVGELVGLPNYQHLVSYSKPELRWFGCVPNFGSRISWTPRQMKLLKSAIGNSEFKIAESRLVAVGVQVEDVGSALQNITDFTENESLTDGGEGRVVYAVARLPETPPPDLSSWNSDTLNSNNPTTINNIQDVPMSIQHPTIDSPSSSQQSSYTSIVPIEIQNEILVGLSKCKTLEYFLVRRIREKCRHFANSEHRQNRHTTCISTLIEEYTRLSLQQVSNPLLVSSFQPLIEKYTNLFQRALIFLVNHPTVSSEYVNHQLLDFLQDVQNSLEPTSITPRHPLKIHFLTPPFLITPSFCQSIVDLVPPDLLESLPSSKSFDPLPSSNQLITLNHFPVPFAREFGFDLLEGKELKRNLDDAENSLVVIWGYSPDGILKSAHRSKYFASLMGPSPPLLEPDVAWMPDGYQIHMTSLTQLRASTALSPLWPKTPTDVTEKLNQAIGAHVDIPMEPTSNEPTIGQVLESANSEAFELLTSRPNCYELLLKTWHDMTSKLKTIQQRVRRGGRRKQRDGLRLIIMNGVPPQTDREIETHSDFKKLKGIVFSCLRACCRTPPEEIPKPIPRGAHVTPLPILKLTVVFAMGIPGSGKSTLFQGVVRGVKQLGGCGNDWDGTTPHVVIRTKQLESWLNDNEADLLLKECASTWDFVCYMSSDNYTAEETLRCKRSCHGATEEEFRKCHRAGVKKQIDNLDNTINQDLNSIMLKALANIRRIATTQDFFINDLRPIHALIIMDKNHPPDAVPNAIRSFRHHAATLARNPALTIPVETPHGLILPVVHCSIGAVVLPTPDVANGGLGLSTILQEGSQSTLQEAISQLGLLKQQFGSWTFPWSIDAVCEAIYRVASRTDHPTLQDGMQSIHILLSFLSLHRNWTPNQLVHPPRKRPSSSLNNNNGNENQELPDFVIECPTLKPQMLLSHSEDPQQTAMTSWWIQGMRELLRTSMAPGQLKPFNGFGANEQKYQQMVFLCSSDVRPPEPKEEIDDQIQMNIELFFTRLIDSVKTTGTRVSSLPSPIPSPQLARRSFQPPSFYTQYPVYSYIDISPPSSGVDWNQMLHDFTNIAEQFVSLGNDRQIIPKPHITSHYFGRPHPNTARLPEYIAAKERLNQVYRYNVTHLVCASGLVSFAAVAPTVNHNSDGLDIDQQSISLSLPPCEFGRFPHVTLCTSRGVPPRMSNNVLEGLANCSSHSLEFYRSPGPSSTPIGSPNTQANVTVADGLIFIDQLILFDPQNVPITTKCLIMQLDPQPQIQGPLSFFFQPDFYGDNGNNNRNMNDIENFNNI